MLPPPLSLAIRYRVRVRDKNRVHSRTTEQAPSPSLKKNKHIEYITHQDLHGRPETP